MYIHAAIYCTSLFTDPLNLVPRAFPLKDGWGATHFLREKPWGRGWDPLFLACSLCSRARRCFRKELKEKFNNVCEQAIYCTWRKHWLAININDCCTIKIGYFQKTYILPHEDNSLVVISLSQLALFSIHAEHVHYTIRTNSSAETVILIPH